MIDFPEILQNIHLKISSKNCRENNLFYIKNVTTSYYISNSPSNILMLLVFMLIILIFLIHP